MAGVEKKGGVKVHEARGLRYFGLWLLALMARAFFATLRFSVRKGDEQALYDATAPSVLVIWHNRILFSPKIRRLYRNKRQVHAAISASRDGATISAFVGMLGIASRRGSSSKRATAVAMELLQVLKNGDDVAITPDGPRGPIYTLHEGAAALALMAKAPVILVCPNPKSGWRANSWDGFYVPYPFSRVEMRAVRIRPEELPQDRDACAAFIRKGMLALTEDLKSPPRCAKALEAPGASGK
jgi:lysophospholipid acyltransferase (LPLAT)-like uncharacterized protein